MLILAINCGSSSLKGALVDSDSGRRLFDKQVENGGDHQDAVCLLLEVLRRSPGQEPRGVAHRIVHGGDRFLAPTLITDEVLDALSGLNGLAPLHNPPALAALRVVRESLHGIPHVAVFDTAFHATLPLPAYRYALPESVCGQSAIRRYGFHGINHAHVMDAVASELRRPAGELRIVSCHLGNGASVTAIEHGRSVETSMGMTPLEGLVMGTRSGDVDPGVLMHLLRSGSCDAVHLDHLLNHESGLQGLTGTNDLREIERRAAQGEEACENAIAIYAHRVRKYIGAYAAVMGGVDVIAFTGGIGEHSRLMRERILQRLEFLGAQVLVVPADEEGKMAREAAGLIATSSS